MKLNLGCGPHAIPGWTNLDIEAAPGVQVHDLRKKLPFERGSFTHVFTEHFIEHITRAEGVALLKECYRVMAVGGVLRVSTPNLELIAKLYLEGEIDGWKEVWAPETPCQFMNEAMRLWGHQFLYDRLELVDVLSEAGFEDIRACEWRDSQYEDLKGREVRPFKGELILEAVKHSDALHSKLGYEVS